MTRSRSPHRFRVAGIRLLIALALIPLVMLGLRHRFRGGLRETARGLYRQAKALRTTVLYRAQSVPAEQADAPLVIYADTLAGGWVDWSWTAHDTQSVAQVKSGACAIRMTPEPYKGVYLHHAAFSTAGYGAIEFWLYTTVPSPALTLVAANAGNSFGPKVSLSPSHTGWSRITIPLNTLGVTPSDPQISGFAVQEASGKQQPDIYIDDIRLVPDTTLPPAPLAATVSVTVDTTRNNHPISPLIYGVAHLPAEEIEEWHIAADRWGGNANTRYNWQANTWNSARDWHFRSHGWKSGAHPAGAAADAFIQANTEAGVATVLTVPTIGWVTRGGDSPTESVQVPRTGGPALAGDSEAIAGYDPRVNRERTSVRSVARTRDAHPGEVSQEEWVRHLVATHGDAAHGGVPIYAMDNEPDLWDSTHTDIHPVRMGYDAVLANFVDYATMVKEIDPTALVTGPVVSGWTAYSYSSLDRGTDNFRTHTDRDAHEGTPFVPWFLQQVRARDEKAGQRSLDILDIHYYPQGTGIYGAAADTDTRTRRLRATRSWWDPSYVDESWIGEPVRLLPRLKEWVDANYPGTKIGITEWNFGADTDISGALAIADTLGIFGRENIFLANYWTYPRKDSLGFLAFQLYRNPDGAGHGFGSVSCHAETTDSDRLSCFAATDPATGVLTLVLINKMRKATITAPVTVQGVPLPPVLNLYRLTATSTALIPDTVTDVVAGRFTITLPPYSAVFVRCGKEVAP